VKRTSGVRVLYLALLSKPPHERAIFKTIRNLRANSVVEFGVGLGLRSQRMITMLRRNHDADDVHYVGIDLFEARAAGSPGMTLKQAHRSLAETGVQIRLVPGDPFSALARTANELTGTDLVVIGADQDSASLREAWFYLPRMLHDQSLVLIEQADQSGFEVLNSQQVSQRATATAKGRAA
jgi:predicted O-methyltransferase YrrM